MAIFLLIETFLDGMNLGNVEIKWSQLFKYIKKNSDFFFNQTRSGVEKIREG